MAQESPIDDTLHMASVSQPTNPVSVSSSEGIRRNVLKFFAPSVAENTIPAHVKLTVDNVLAMVNKDNIDAAITALSKTASQDKDAFVQYLSQIRPSGMNLMQDIIQNVKDVTVANKLGDFLKQYAPRQTDSFVMDSVIESEAPRVVPQVVPQVAPQNVNTFETSPMPSDFAQQTFSATSPMPPTAQAPQTVQEDKGFLQTIKDFFGKPLGLTGGESSDNNDADLTTEQIIEKVINGTLDGGSSMISGTRHANRYFDYSVSGGAKKKRSSKKVHDMSREVNDIHDRTVASIKKLMKCTDEEAQTYKSVLYRRVKAEHPELSSKDRALKMEELATKDVLKAIDLPAEMKKREIEKSEHPPREKSEKSDRSDKTAEKSEKKTKKSKKDSESSDSFNLSL
jgi:hypothetical protein